MCFVELHHFVYIKTYKSEAKKALFLTHYLSRFPVPQKNIASPTETTSCPFSISIFFLPITHCCYEFLHPKHVSHVLKLYKWKIFTYTIYKSYLKLHITHHFVFYIWLLSLNVMFLRIIQVISFSLLFQFKKYFLVVPLFIYMQC